MQSEGNNGLVFDAYIEKLDAMISENPDRAWESVLEMGRLLSAEDTNFRWRLGDLAARLPKPYGANAVGSFAAGIKQGVSAVKSYMTVAQYYTPQYRDTFEGAVSWSHYRAAMNRNDDVDLSMDYLAKAAEADWSAERLAQQIKADKGDKPRPELLLACEGKITAVKGLEGTITITVSRGVSATLINGLGGKEVNLTLKTLV